MCINICIIYLSFIRSHNNSQHTTMLLNRLTMASLCCWLGAALTFVALAIPLSSSVYTEYVYNYEANIAFEPSSSLIKGLKIRAKAHLETLYAAEAGKEAQHQQQSSQLVRLRLTEPLFYEATATLEKSLPPPLAVDRKFSHLYNQDHHLYAHIVTLANGTAYIKELFTHQADSATFKNLKKSILLNLLPTSQHNKPIVSADNNHHMPIAQSCIDDNNLAQPEMFSPDSISRVLIVAKPKVKTKSAIESTTASGNSGNFNPSQAAAIFQTVDGYQNVTFKSRVFSEAVSELRTNFRLELVNELKSDAHEQFDQAQSLKAALKLLADKANYQADTIGLQREKRVCSHHHCGMTLQQLFENYREELSNESMASVQAAVAFLRLLERLRESKGTNVNDILTILKHTRGTHDGTESSFLDVLAAARTKDSILASLKYLNLPKNDNLDVAERFLSVLSVVAKTTSKMQLKRQLQSPYYFTPTSPLKRSKQLREQESHLASIEFIAQEFLRIITQTPSKKWKSHKLRWSSLLTLATLSNAHEQDLRGNQESSSSRQVSNDNNDDLIDQVSQLLLKELKSCDGDDTECRIVVLQAIGNVGRLSDKQFAALRDQVLNSSRRVSIAAMKVLRDLLQHQPKDKPKSELFYLQLKKLLLRVVYDSSHETTTRVLASEIMVRFVPNSLVSVELLHHLPSFNNTELATMIYSRMQSLRPDTLAKHNDNWYWQSCIVHGKSASFVKTLAKTDSLTASYGVNVELMNSVKVLKESSFDVFLDTQKRTQDLFSLGVFARGLSSFMGNSEEDDESTVAGMSLRLLGGYLRPYIFFTSKGELMGHVWSGTASEPTTVFNGNLLLIDHLEGYPLISGFVAEQQMRGVLSIDVTGSVKISIWHRSSNSIVQTRASVIVQASQSVFTSYDNFWQAHLFSFGGETSIDFKADTDFASSPARICLQVTSPEFIVRYNSRKRDQMMTNEVRRKLTKKSNSIGAKSYPLNRENNDMCSLMRDEL